MTDVGLIGWRGMVGSVLLQRMREENDFKYLNAHFFSTSNPGGKAPAEDSDQGVLKDAFDIDTLKKMNTILTCQGGDYTQKVYPELRKAGWKGYWIDAASTLRGEDSSVLTLDPINSDQIEKGLKEGKRILLAPIKLSFDVDSLGDLFKKDLVEWTTSMTYQVMEQVPIMKELLKQMNFLGGKSWKELIRKIFWMLINWLIKFIGKDFPKSSSPSLSRQFTP